MKKSIIAASAASLALAAMPVVSTFAATTYDVRDNINLTVDNTCSLSRTASTSDETVTGSSNFTNDGTLPTGMEVSGTYTANMSAGTNGSIGVSTFKITCNDIKDGHNLVVTTTPLTATAESTGLSEGFPTINYVGSSLVPGEGASQASGWNITIAAEQAVVTNLNMTTGILTMTGNSASIYGTNGARVKKNVVESQFTAEYNVGAAFSQQAGTYEGSATYILTNGPAN